MSASSITDSSLTHQNWLCESKEQVHLQFCIESDDLLVIDTGIWWKKTAMRIKWASTAMSLVTETSVWFDSDDSLVTETVIWWKNNVLQNSKTTKNIQPAKAIPILLKLQKLIATVCESLKTSILSLLQTLHSHLRRMRHYCVIKIGIVI